MKENPGLKIRIYGDPVLRKKAKPIQDVIGEHRKILSQMAQLMLINSGVGLAAPQIGISEKMIVVDIGSGLYKLINPEITKKEGSLCLEEGCLSIPGVNIKVKRAKKICLKALDEFGKPLFYKAEGLLACVFQHEIDHLNGKLIIDYASLFQRLKIAKKLEKLKRAKDERVLKSKAEFA
ncbi:MAG: peptide deformylase [Candidatus Omnitrophota bacterium]|nr:peptide deformylase [Candidatus Omnitrophota bacterium]